MSNLAVGQFVKITGLDRMDESYEEHYKQIELQKQPGWKPPENSYPIAINHDHKNSIGKRGVIVWMFEPVATRDCRCARVRIFNDRYYSVGQFGSLEHDYDYPEKCLEPIEADDLKPALLVMVKDYVEKHKQYKAGVRREKADAIQEVKDIAEEYELSMEKAERLYRRFDRDGGYALDKDVDSEDSYPGMDPELIKAVLGGAQ